MFNTIRFALISILLFTSSIAFGEVKAVIDGPEKIEFGSLLVLSAKESICDNHEWIVDSKFNTPVRVDKQAKELWSGLPGPGIFEFTLIVTNKDAEIAFTRKTVEVTLPSWLGPPKPPIDPPKPPILPNSELKTETEKLTKAVNDKEGTSKLIYQLDALLSSSEEITPIRLQKVFDDFLLKRTGESAKKNWIDSWRKPIDALIGINLQKGILLKDCVSQIAEGLRSSLPSLANTKKPILPLATILYEKTPGCPPCERFSRDVLPLLKNEGHSFNEIVSSNRPAYPYFEISINGKTIIHTGELSLFTFHNLIGK